MGNEGNSKDDLVESDFQKTHYFIRGKKRRKSDVFGAILKSGRREMGETPIPRLLNGREDGRQVKRRYERLEEVWKERERRIERLVDNANTEVFARLLSYAQAPLQFQHEGGGSNGSEYNELRREYKLPVAFLLLGSNTANNGRIVQEFYRYVVQQGEQSIKMVTLDSKSCVNIKATLREVVRQVLSKDNDDDEKTGDRNGERNGQVDSDEEIEGEEEGDEEGDDDNDNDVEYDGRITYDFDIVEEWCSKQFSREKETYRTSNLRLIIVLQDTDSISKQVLNQLVKLIHSYSRKLPIKMIMGLSSHNVSDWVNETLSNELRVLIDGVKFKSINNNSLGFKLLEEVFLGYETIDANPLIPNHILSSIISTRFKNSNSSIDILISQLKLTYIIYFYQQPLSNLLDADFDVTWAHVDALRKLPSFKRKIETMIFKYNKQKTSIKKQKNFEDFNQKVANKVDVSKHDSLKKEILNLLYSDPELMKAFQSSREQFETYKLVVINLMNMIYKLQSYSKSHKREKFEIYSMITNNQLKNSAFLRDLLVGVKSNIEDFTSFLVGQELHDQLGGRVSDENLIKLKANVRSRPSGSTIVSEIIQYIENGNSYRLNDLLFYEVFTLDGGSYMNIGVKLEENYENLMLNLARPKLRAVIELGLNDPPSYLQNDLITQSENTHLPITCQLFQIYKDAPATVNICDFYVAFKQSLPKIKLIDELLCTIDDSNLKNKLIKCKESDDILWDKITFSWFLQSCFELIIIGFLKEKSKTDYLEKAIWINL